MLAALHEPNRKRPNNRPDCLPIWSGVNFRHALLASLNRRYAISDACPVTSVTRENFGYLIAYVIPGFVVVSIFAGRFDVVRDWLGFSATFTGPTVGGFLYVTIASVTAGMLLGALRWATLDPIHQHTGLKQPPRDYASMHGKTTTFHYLVEVHYRYYEFYGHMLLSVLVGLIDSRHLSLVLGLPTVVVFVTLFSTALLLFFASRDALKNYYERTHAILRSKQPSTR